MKDLGSWLCTVHTNIYVEEEVFGGRNKPPLVHRRYSTTICPQGDPPTSSDSECRGLHDHVEGSPWGQNFGDNLQEILYYYSYIESYRSKKQKLVTVEGQSSSIKVRDGNSMNFES